MKSIKICFTVIVLVFILTGCKTTSDSNQIVNNNKSYMNLNNKIDNETDIFYIPFSRLIAFCRGFYADEVIPNEDLHEIEDGYYAKLELENSNLFYFFNNKKRLLHIVNLPTIKINENELLKLEEGSTYDEVLEIDPTLFPYQDKNGAPLISEHYLFESQTLLVFHYENSKIVSVYQWEGFNINESVNKILPIHYQFNQD